MRAYSPDSLIIVIPLGVSKLSFWQFCLSAASTCFFKAPKVSEYPNAVATSFPTNHGSPEISTVLSSPNCGWVNIVGACVGVDASERWGTHLTHHCYVLSFKVITFCYSLNVFPFRNLHTKGMSICDTPSFVTKEECLFHSPSMANGIESTLWNTADFIRVYLSEINLCFQRNTFPAMPEK